MAPIYTPGPSMRLITDVFAYAERALPRWNTISISGYHIREAGSTAVQEVAFTLANGIAYVEAALERAWMSIPLAPSCRSFSTCTTIFLKKSPNSALPVAYGRVSCAIASRRPIRGTNAAFSCADGRQ